MDSIIERNASELADEGVDRFEHPDNAARALDLAADTVRDRHDLDHAVTVFSLVVHPPNSTSYLKTVTADPHEVIEQRAVAEKDHGIGTCEIQEHEVYPR